jgi:hypothetical protein
LALDLYEVGEQMKRQQLRRRLGSDADAEDALVEWRRHRPGGEPGDAPGRPSTRFGALPA